MSAWWLVGVLGVWLLGIACVVYGMYRSRILDEPTTKECPECGNLNLVLISTQNLKVCTDCNTEIPWTKDEGQSDYR